MQERHHLANSSLNEFLPEKSRNINKVVIVVSGRQGEVSAKLDRMGFCLLLCFMVLMAGRGVTGTQQNDKTAILTCPGQRFAGKA